MSEPGPRIALRPPGPNDVRRFLESAERASFSYAERGATRGPVPTGYDHDHNRIRLGSGEQTFQRARRALEGWEMFPPAWTRVRAPRRPPAAGDTVAVVVHLLGAWWLNAARIVYVLDERGPVRRAGFAYGTLTCHVERGEECFSVEHSPDDSVWYDLRAFSRPAFWPARCAKPIARALQGRFVRHSQAALLAAVRAQA